MGPICNTGSVPKTVTWYWHFVCTDIAFEPNFPHGGIFYKKSAFMIFDSYQLKLSVRGIRELTTFFKF